MDREELGRTAYTAYASYIGEGEKMDTWEELPESERMIHRYVGEAVVKAYQEARRSSKVIELTQTCTSNPSQWEGVLADGRRVYIRFRWSTLTAQIVVDDGPWQLLYKRGDGKGYDGLMDTDEMIAELSGVLDFSEVM